MLSIENIMRSLRRDTPLIPWSGPLLPLVKNGERLPSSPYILRVNDSCGRTWVVLHPNAVWGCSTCVDLKVNSLRRRYPCDGDARLEEDMVVRLLSQAWIGYGVPLALTEGYPRQPWSVVMPAPRCPDCAAKTCRKLSDYVFSISSPSSSTPADESSSFLFDLSSLLQDERSIEATEFISNNRWAVGFMSVMANPVPVPTEGVVSLVNSPVVTGPETDDHEVAGGKGGSLEQALASCIGEGLERFFLAANAQLPRRVASLNEIKACGCSFLDPLAGYGYPARDPFVTELRKDSKIEWVAGNEFNLSEVFWVPANLVFCPYRPEGGAIEFTIGSTNGAATGASPREAIRQGLFELIERDAFWYYSRHSKAPLIMLNENLIPDDVRMIANSYPGTFSFQVLPSPFAINICQVTYCRSGNGIFCARGTGAKLGFEDALRRAFAECIQLMTSLSMDDVKENPLEMRAAWADGRALRLFPQFFDLEGSRIDCDFKSKDFSVDNLVSSFEDQQLRACWCVIARSRSFSVVHAALPPIGLMDSSYYRHNDRFERFRASLEIEPSDITYHASLFM